jgi:hypothetical protein
VSPSHTHVCFQAYIFEVLRSDAFQAFLGLGSGEIKTYDLLCLQISPYTVPNMWTPYENKIAASGSLVTSDSTEYGLLLLASCHRIINISEIQLDTG